LASSVPNEREMSAFGAGIASIALKAGLGGRGWRRRTWSAIRGFADIDLVYFNALVIKLQGVWIVWL